MEKYSAFSAYKLLVVKIFQFSQRFEFDRFVNFLFFLFGCLIIFNVVSFSMVQFIISQIFGGIALILVCISYFLSKNKFLFFQIVANLFYGAAFLVSLSLVAGINTIISILRCLLILYYEKQNKDFPIYFLVTFCLIYISVGVVFYKNAWDIITMFSPTLFTIAMIMRKMIVVKWFMLFPNLALILYCVFNKFYTSAILDLVEFIVILVAIVMYYIEKHRKKDTSYNIIKKIAFDK